jgi:hypothetical protein
MNRSHCALGAAACAALLSATWLVSSSQAQADTPIIVSDGSIVIEDPGGDLNAWSAQGANMLVHPQGNKRMGSVEVTGPGAISETCSNKGLCVIRISWSTGQSVRVFAAQGGNRGLRLGLQGAAFNSPNWSKSSKRWSLPLEPGAEPTVTIRDESTNGQPKVICKGTGCRVLVRYND